jgi:hypothetical protein
VFPAYTVANAFAVSAPLIRGSLLRRFFLLLGSALLALPAIVASATLPETSAVLRGSAYIRTTQLPDGSYSTSAGQTMDAIFAMRAAGYDPAKETIGGKSPADYVKANAAATSGAAAAGKAALGAKAAGLDPKAVDGADLIAKINAAYDSAKGTYAADDFSQSIAMLGLACTGNSVQAGAVAALKTNQVAADGGWGFGGVSDPDTTAIAVQALLAAGVAKTDPAVTKALAYFTAHQGDDGGFGYDTTASNASSTAFVVQALLALGENSEGAAWLKGGVSPVAYLLTQQQPDGSFLGFDPAFATNQVLPALAGRTYCNAPETPITRTRPAVTPTATPATPTATPTSPATQPPATQTSAPKPPATGDSGTNGGDASQREVVVLGVALVVLGGTLSLATRSRRERR